MSVIKVKSIIVVLFVSSLFLMGNVQTSYSNVGIRKTISLEELSEEKLGVIEPIHDLDKPTLVSKVEGGEVQSSGQITEESIDFINGIMENVTLTSNGYLQLKRETTSRIWTQTSKISSSGGLARYGHSMIYNSLSMNFTLFGGSNYQTLLSDTWTYDLYQNTWANMAPSTSPNARRYHSMVYNTNFDKGILFGGFSGAYLSDTWIYDLENNVWTNMNPENHPNGRAEHSMIYDSNLDKVILFGGFNGSSYFNDTWVYDLDTNTWTEMPFTNSPGVRSGHSMVYHSEETKVVLFGGGNASNNLDDTWIYDLETNIWGQKNPLNPPNPRKLFAMAYEVHSSKIILYGGTYPSLDTWQYDLCTDIWTKIEERVEEIGMFSGWWFNSQSLTYDSTLEKLVYFGGYHPVNDACSPEVVILGRNYYQRGIYTSGSYSFDNIYQISGNITWNPVVQPRDLELKVQIGFSNTTNDEDFYYIDYSTSRFSSLGLAQHIRYRVIFESSEREYWITTGWTALREFSPIFSKFTMDYIIEKPQPKVQITNPVNLSMVEGSIPISALTRAPNGIEKVTFYVSGLLQKIDYSTPYNFIWNTSEVKNGNITIIAVSVSKLGRDNSDAIQVFVNNTVKLISSTTVPSKPQNLFATPVENIIRLTWNEPVEDGGFPIIHYKVYRGLRTEEYSLLGVTLHTNYTDYTITRGEVNYYIIAAVNGEGEGDFSTEISASTPELPGSLPLATIPDFPNNLIAEAKEDYVTLNWTAPTDDGGSPITRFNIYRGTTSGAYILIGVVSSSQNSFQDSLILAETNFFYVVTALNIVGESSFSNEVTVTTTISAATIFPELLAILLFLSSYIVIKRKLRFPRKANL